MVDNREKEPDVPKKKGASMAEQYLVADTMRNGEANLRWARAGLFITLHTGALFVGLPLLLRVDMMLLYRMSASVVVAIAGVLLALVWKAVNKRAHVVVEYWNAVFEELEHGSADTIPIFSSERFKTMSTTPWTFHQTVQAFVWTFVGIWGIIGLGSFVAAVTLLVIGRSTT